MTDHYHDHDAIVLVQRPHDDWTVAPSQRPLFVCAEMFLDLRDIEQRRWRMWQLRNSLVDAGLFATTLSDFLHPDDIAWLEHQGARVAHEWYLERESDRTMYRGISLGRCIEYEVKARAIRLLKLWLTVRRLIQRHPGCTLFADFAPDSTEWKLLELLGQPVQRFGALSATSQTSPPQAQPSWRSRLISSGRRWGLSAMRLLSRLFAWRRDPALPLVVVRVGMQSAKMLERWVAGPRPAVRFSLWMNYLMRPRTVLSLVLAGASIPETSVLGHAATAPELDAALDWPSRRTSVAGTDAHLGDAKALAPLIDEMLCRITRTGFRVARTDIDDAYATLGEPATALLVIPNDCQPVMRAWTLVAKRLARRTLVLQHGHLDYTEDEDHLTADHSAFWSTMVAQDYLSAGLQPHQIIVTGSPNADEYCVEDYRPWPSKQKLSGKTRVLVITTGNPAVQAYISETWVCDYIAGVLEALAPRLSEIEMVVKLHPGEDAGLYKANLGSLLPPGTAVDDRGNLARLIAEADVVISPPSTVVIEARAGGTPVILVRIPSVDNRATTLQHAEGVATVRDYRELGGAIDRIVAGRREDDAQAWPLSRFLGPLDGHASKRLLEAVHDLASAPQGFSNHRPA
ncbi:MAG: hypothetical protein JF606_08040 [Burkholderiales bacterium]|nr:hypothetical protein [Burkholderiales bacterium]